MRTRAKDLELAQLGHSLPLLHGTTRSCDVSKGGTRLPGRAGAGEVDALVAVGDSELVASSDQPAREGRHRNAAVLQLGVAEPCERRRRAQISEAERIPHDIARLLRGALPEGGRGEGEDGSEGGIRAELSRRRTLTLGEPGGRGRSSAEALR